MERQYIGARYVPKFFNNNGSNEWVSGINYEALTVVRHLNRTYTSTKPVPSNIGAPNTAPSYWVETGDTTTLDNLTNAIHNVDVDLQGYKRDTNLELASINSDIDNIEGILARTNLARKYIFVGDSYAGTNTGWETWLLQFMGLTSSDFVNCIADGSSFTSSTPATNWNSMLTDVVGNMTSDEKNHISDVVCIGGINDAMPYASFNVNNDEDAFQYTYNAILTFATTVKNNLPNAKIHLFFVGNTDEGLDAWNRTYNNIIRTISAWASSASTPNVVYHHGCEYILHDYSYMSDDAVHPNMYGCAEIARFVANELYGGNNYTNPVGYGSHTDAGLIVDTTSPSSGILSITNNGTNRTLLDGNLLSIEYTAPINILMDTVTLTDNTTLTFGEAKNKGIVHGKNLVFNCQCTIVTSDYHGFKVSDAQLILHGGIFKIHLRKINPDYTINSTSNVLYVVVDLPKIMIDMLQN